MPDKIRAEDFSRHLGKTCRIACPEGPAFDLVVDTVEEKNQMKRPQDSRSPFSVVLKGLLEPSFLYGSFDMAIEAEPFLRGVYIERIAPPWGLDPDSAYYQIIFN